MLLFSLVRPTFSCKALADLYPDFTPTVGLGCRSGGYTIYIVIALASFAIELIVWWSTSQDSVRSRVRRYSVENPWMLALSKTFSRGDHDARAVRAQHSIQRRFSWLTETPIHVKIEYFLLRPLDLVNSTWCAYIVLAQTFGSYQSCQCMSSTWSKQVSI